MEMMTTIGSESDLLRKRKSRDLQIGKRLRSARKNAKLPLAAVAEVCKVTRASVCNWEGGRHPINHEQLAKAAARLNISVDWLLTGTGLPYVNRSNQPVHSPIMMMGAGIVEMKNGVGSGAEYSAKAPVHGHWNLPPSQTENLGVDPRNLKAFRVLTDNLAPDIPQGGTVFVDFKQTRPVDGGVFAIDNGLSVILKCMHVDGSLDATIALSDCHSKGKEVVKKGKLKILGRVVAVFSPLNVVSNHHRR